MQYFRIAVEIICFHECDFIPTAMVLNIAFGFHPNPTGTRILHALALANFASSGVNLNGAGGSCFCLPCAHEVGKRLLIFSSLRTFQESSAPDIR